MPNTQDYLKRYKNQNSNMSTQQATNGTVKNNFSFDNSKDYSQSTTNNYATRAAQSSNQNTNTNNNDYYQLARDQEYSLLLDKEVALENAKSNAMKYTQNALAANGLNNLGYGSSIQSGIYNNYINRAAQAQADYANNIRDINMQENEYNQQNANDRFESITTMLTAADSVDSMNNLLVDYGYGTVDGDGNFVWGTKPEGMSDDDWYQMKYYYNLQANALNSAGNINTYNSLEGLQNYFATLSGQVNDDGTLSQKYGNEANALWSYASAGAIQNNSVISVTNADGNTIFVRWTSSGFVPASETDYINSSSKYKLDWNSSQRWQKIS